MVAGLAHAAPGDFDSGFYFPFNDKPLVSLNGAQGVANGNAAISFVSPTLDGTQTTFDGTLDSNDEVATFSSTINLRGALTLEVRVDAAGDFSRKIRLPTTALPAITVGDVVVTPFAAMTINVSGTADASGRVSVVAPFEAGAQFELVLPGQPAISFSTVPRFKPELGAPDATAAIELNADLEVGVVFLVAINGVEIGGPVPLDIGGDRPACLRAAIACMERGHCHGASRRMDVSSRDPREEHSCRPRQLECRGWRAVRRAVLLAVVARL